MFRELGKLLGIKLVMSTVHHPQTDGASERANQESKAYLSEIPQNMEIAFINTRILLQHKATCK